LLVLDKLDIEIIDASFPADGIDFNHYWAKVRDIRVPPLTTLEGKAGAGCVPDPRTCHDFFYKVFDALSDLHTACGTTLLYETGFSDSDLAPDFVLVPHDNVVPSSTSHLLGLEIKSTNNFLCGQQQSMKYCSLKLVNILDSIGVSGGCTSHYSGQPKTEGMKPDDRRRIVDAYAAWLNKPVFSSYMSTEQISVVAISMETPKRHVVTLENLPRRLTGRQFELPALTLFPSRLPLEPTEGFKLLCRLLKASHAKLGAPSYPHLRDFLGLPENVEVKDVVGRGGSSIAYHVRYDGADGILKMPLLRAPPSLCPIDERFYHDEMNVLNLLKAHWESLHPAESEKAPFPVVQQLAQLPSSSGAAAPIPYMVCTPLGRPLKEAVFGSAVAAGARVGIDTTAIFERALKSILLALECAHSLPVYHSDVRVSNIVYSSERAVLIDWGHAVRESSARVVPNTTSLRCQHCPKGAVQRTEDLTRAIHSARGPFLDLHMAFCSFRRLLNMYGHRLPGKGEKGRFLSALDERLRDIDTAYKTNTCDVPEGFYGPILLTSETL
jgi:hypothetical protein